MSNSIAIQKGIKKRTRAIRYAGALVALLALLWFSTPTAWCQCTLSSPDTWTLAGNGNWSNGNNWSGGAPNSSSTNVCITNGSSTVTLDTSASVGNLQLSAGNALNFNTGQHLGVNGNQIINGGQIMINGNAAWPYTELDINTNVRISGGGTITLQVNPIWPNGADISLGPTTGTATLDNVDNTIEGDGSIFYAAGSTIINEAEGTILANLTANPFWIQGYGFLTNNGTLRADSGTALTLSAPVLTNFSGNTLTGGTYYANGTIELDSLGSTGAEIVNNAANIILNAANGGVASIVDAAGLDALTGLTTNSGSLTLLNGRTLEVSAHGGPFQNSGTVLVDAYSVLEMNNTPLNGGVVFTKSYQQTAGVTQIDGRLTGSSGSTPVNIQGGILKGTGTITGNVTVSGTGIVHPGDSPGVLFINGNYDTSQGGTLAIDLGGTTVGQYSALAVGGDVILGTDATVDFTTVGGFTPAVGDDFTFLAWTGNLTGNFGDPVLTNWVCPGTCTVEEGPGNSFTLDIDPGPTVPEPSTVVLLGTAMAMAGFLELRKAISGR